MEAMLEGGQLVDVAGNGVVLVITPYDLPKPCTDFDHAIMPVYPGARRESRPGESHPEALAEPYVTLSRHTAPIKEPPRILAQGANRCGERRETAATHRLARRT